jgi:hypothetical protein
MTEALSLQAVFIRNPYANFAGTYRGLLTLPGFIDSQQNFGAGVVTCSRTGVLTGRIQIGTASRSFRAELNGKGRASVKLPVPGTTALDLAFSVDLDRSTSDAIQVQAGSDGIPLVSGTLERSVKALSEVAGGITEGLTSGAISLSSDTPGSDLPAANGELTVNVKKSGALSIVGRLGDGARFSYGTVLNATGGTPLAATLYKNKGLLAGGLLLSAEPRTVSGSARWFRPVMPNDKQFPDGWPKGIDVQFGALPQ